MIFMEWAAQTNFAFSACVQKEADSVSTSSNGDFALLRRKNTLKQINWAEKANVL